MTHDELAVIRAAYELGHGDARLIEYRSLSAKSGLADAVIRSIAAHLRQERLCIATFGGLQLTAAGLDAARGERVGD